MTEDKLERWPDDCFRRSLRTTGETKMNYYDYEPSTTVPKNKCGHCGAIGGHEGTCPQIKSIEYYPNGTIKKVEYKG